MLIGFIIFLWIADIVFQFFRYRKDGSVSKTCNCLGMICAMIASVIITYLISLADRQTNTISIVNGVRVSPGTHTVLMIFCLWMIIGAVLNLLAMGIGYFLSGIELKKR